MAKALSVNADKLAKVTTELATAPEFAPDSVMAMLVGMLVTFFTIQGNRDLWAQMATDTTDIPILGERWERRFWNFVFDFLLELALALQAKIDSRAENKTTS